MTSRQVCRTSAKPTAKIAKNASGHAFGISFLKICTDYTAFIRAASGSRMADDPLCEVGCPYAVRGFDYDFVGTNWLNDLVWREGKWVMCYDFIHEGGFLHLLNRARDEESPKGPENRELLRRGGQAYRILLTRPLKGAYLWIPHNDTRQHLVCLFSGIT